MTNQAETMMTLTDAPGDDERAVITEGLRTYNEAEAGTWDGRPLAILARDPETKKVVGGLLGRTSLGLLRVDTFFLPEDLRRGRLGSRILAMAEEDGRRGRTAARLYPCAIVDASFPGAGLLSEAGLGSRRPDRLRGARPYPVPHDQETILIHL